MTVSVLRVCLLLVASACAQPSTCGGKCTSDVECPDARGLCTYCRSNVCSNATSTCVGGPTPGNTTKKQLLVVGDSISIGYSPQLFAALEDEYEGQHVPTNGGPCSKGYHCIERWLGRFNTPPHPQWDLVVFNFGLHSLDRPFTAEAETLANYTRELRFIAGAITNMSQRTVWVTTTPVPLKVTTGPARHNKDVLAFNDAARQVAEDFTVPISDVYSAVMKQCPETSGAPDFTYVSCPLQSPGGVHFPSHYDVLVDELVLTITGKTPPPTPAPLGCAALEHKAGCVAGGTATCSTCFGNAKTKYSHRYWDPCLVNYTSHVPPIAHPEETFVQCFCFENAADCY